MSSEKFKKSEFHRNGADVADHSRFYRDAAVSNEPTHEEIAARAYEIFLKRGSAPGREIEDWLEAEKELIDKKQR